jgi:aspartate aminotransferase
LPKWLTKYAKRRTYAWQKLNSIPGISFGADDYLRISYATSRVNIEKGLDRLEKFIKSLNK